jgi:hypothetical protein
MYLVKQNVILGGMCYCTEAQLHVSAIKVDHLQAVNENISYRMWGGGGAGGRFEILGGSGKVCLVYVLTSMSKNGLHIDLYKGILVTILSTD